jgi:hypothetical protein
MKLLHAARARAKGRGIKFNLDITDIVVPDVCPVLSIPLFDRPGARTNNSPTLDRVHPDIGYVKGNVAVISWKANRLKNNATPEELEKINQFVQEWITTHTQGP